VKVGVLSVGLIDYGVKTSSILNPVTCCRQEGETLSVINGGGEESRVYELVKTGRRMERSGAEGWVGGRNEKLRESQSENRSQKPGKTCGGIDRGDGECT